jgi:hypothetical protein
MRGRALPLPPLVPLVGALGVMLGFVLGSGLAPKAVPLPLPSPAAIAAASPSVRDPLPVVSEPTASLLDESAASGAPFAMPPADGLSLGQALKALEAIRANGTGAAPPAVVSARVLRSAGVAFLPSAASGGPWVWEIVIRGTFLPVSCGLQPLGTPALCPWAATTQRIVLDYETGAFLEATSPVLP